MPYDIPDAVKIPEEISRRPNGDTWELAIRMLEVYDAASKDATGTGKTRRIVRMCEVVKALRKEFSS